jgi:hypothetical protein
MERYVTRAGLISQIRVIALTLRGLRGRPPVRVRMPFDTLRYYQ